MNGRLIRFGIFGFILLALVLATGASTAAQTISGVVAGKVVSQDNKAVEGATVTIKNKLTGRERYTSTNVDGEFRFLEVAPGDYEITFEKEGFESVKHANVRVNLNKEAFEGVTLSIPPVKATAEVTASTPMLERTSPTLSNNFVDRQIQELPILTRDINNLALLAPGVQSVRTFSFASTLVPFSVSGSRGRDNNFIIDSVDNNEPLFGGAAAQFTNTDIFVEYTILTNQLKAEFGRNSGSTVNVITRSGSNDLHGTLFWFGQHDAFNARNAVEETSFLSQPTRYYENVTGFTLGGPIKPNKTLFFVSYQWDRAVNNLTTVYPVVATYPTPAGLTALRSLPQNQGLIALLSTPSVRSVGSEAAFAPVPCFSAAPSTFLTPAQAAFFSQNNPCHVSNALVGTTAVPMGSYVVGNGNLFNVRDHQFSGRIDHRLGNNQDLYGRYLFDDIAVPRFPNARASDSAFSDSGIYPDFQMFTRQRTQSFVLNHRYYWPDKLNEFRFAYSRISQGIGAYKIPEQVRNHYAAATVTDLNFGTFGAYSTVFPSAGQRFTLGQESSPSQSNTNVMQFLDNFSKVFKSHTVKFGVNFVRTESNILSIPSDLGTYAFGDRIVSPFGLADFAAERAGGSSRAMFMFQRLTNIQSDPVTGNITGQGSAELPLREFDHFYFLQDDWRATPHLTLSFGIRYENYGQPINRVHELNQRAPKVGRDHNNIAPRIGFAWSVFNNTVIRGGYAMMFNPFVLSIPLRMWQSGRISPFVTGDPFRATTAALPSGTYPGQPFTPADVNVLVLGCSTPSDRRTAGTVPLIDCASEDTVDSNLRNPYVHNFSLGIQQQLMSNLLLEVGYVGTKGSELFFARELNSYQGWNNTTGGCADNPPSLLFGFSYNCLRPRLDNRRGSRKMITGDGSSIYHSLQVGLTRRMSPMKYMGNVTFGISYTWAHMTDNGSEIFGPAVRFASSASLQGTFLGAILFDPRTQFLDPIGVLTTTAANPNNLKAERGNSSFDRRHRFVFSYLWGILPDAKNQFVKGWQLGGIFTFQSGQPYSPLNASPVSRCVDYNGDGNLVNDRPAVGSNNAPQGSVALIDTLVNPTCSSRGTLTYIDVTGAPISPANARFVQVPLGVLPGQTFTVGSSTFVAGSAGRNILVGPRIVNMDFALFKTFSWRDDRLKLQFRWEVYDFLNHRSPTNTIGNVYTTEAQPTPAYAFSAGKTPASATGAFPENAIDAKDQFTGLPTFRSTRYLNTSSRHMQFGLKFIF